MPATAKRAIVVTNMLKRLNPTIPFLRATVTCVQIRRWLFSLSFKLLLLECSCDLGEPLEPLRLNAKKAYVPLGWNQQPFCVELVIPLGKKHRPVAPPFRTRHSCY